MGVEFAAVMMGASGDILLTSNISAFSFVAGGSLPSPLPLLFKAPRNLSSKQVQIPSFLAPCLARRPKADLGRTLSVRAAVAISSTENASGTSDVQPSRDEFSGRQNHNELQSQYFDANCELFADDVPENAGPKAAKAVGLANIGVESVVLVCGAVGAGPLVTALREVGTEGIVAADVSIAALSLLKERFDSVRCWHGDIVDLPSGEFGPFDAIFFHDSFSYVYSQEEVLRSAASFVKPGGTIVLSQSQGRECVEARRAEMPQLFLHSLPDKENLVRLLEGLPMEICSFQSDPDLYIAVLKVGEPLLQVPHGSRGELAETALSGPYFFPQVPLFLRGKVVTGFGRGSKKMGIPTANLPPEELLEELQGVSNGVYFGWAQVLAEGVDSSVHKMVMNIGNRPTFVDGEGITVEVHILHEYGEDFYGEEVRAVVLGFVRGEMKFKSIDELVGRIHADIEMSKSALDDRGMKLYRDDPFFATTHRANQLKA